MSVTLAMDFSRLGLEIQRGMVPERLVLHGLVLTPLMGNRLQAGAS